MLEYALKMTRNWGKPDGQYGVYVGLWPGETSLPYLFGGDARLPEHYTNAIAPSTRFNTPEVIESHQWRQDFCSGTRFTPIRLPSRGCHPSSRRSPAASR